VHYSLNAKVPIVNREKRGAIPTQPSNLLKTFVILSRKMWNIKCTVNCSWKSYFSHSTSLFNFSAALNQSNIVKHALSPYKYINAKVTRRAKSVRNLQDERLLQKAGGQHHVGALPFVRSGPKLFLGCVQQVHHGPGHPAQHIYPPVLPIIIKRCRPQTKSSAYNRGRRLKGGLERNQLDEVCGVHGRAKSDERREWVHPKIELHARLHVTPAFLTRKKCFS
jgi:hypothetical protein